MVDNFYEFTLTSLEGDEIDLAQFRGKVALVVNTASECGLTPQLSQLQELYGKYKERGFVIFGFPCNDFGQQEPGSPEQIRSFYESNHHVEFPLFSKIHVKGENIHSLYDYLTRYSVSGYKGDVRWNFEKFLIDKRGHIVARYHPDTLPTDSELVGQIEELLEIGSSRFGTF